MRARLKDIGRCDVGGKGAKNLRWLMPVTIASIGKPL